MKKTFYVVLFMVKYPFGPRQHFGLGGFFIWLLDDHFDIIPKLGFGMDD
jgi:hypothetical protein